MLHMVTVGYLWMQTLTYGYIRLHMLTVGYIWLHQLAYVAVGYIGLHQLIYGYWLHQVTKRYSAVHMVILG